MDPLSLTASVAGIVQLAGAVYQGIAKYIRDVKEAGREVESLAAETRNLFGILNNLSLLVSTLEHDRVPAALQDSHLNALRRTLYVIDLRVNRAFDDLKRGSKADAILRRLRWPFSKDETKELLQDMTRHKDNISLALSADSMTRLMELLSTQQQIQSSVDGIALSIRNLQSTIDAKTEIETRASLNQKRREVIKFFQAVNPQSKFEACVDLRQDMTGLWLLKSTSYQMWTEQPSSRIWLSGIPGSGKTVLCGAIIQDVLQRSTPTTAVAFFFCDYAEPDSQESIQVLGSLAVQLALQKPEAFTILEGYYNELHPPNGLAKPPRLASMEKLLRRLLAEFEKVFVVVDALDECGHNAVDVAQALRDVSQGAPNVSMALLSRDEEPIRDILDDDYHNIQIAAQAEDLTLYLGAQMAARKVFSSMLLRQPALYQDIRRFLLDGAQGMFRWLVCQLDYLEKLPSNGQRRKALNKLPKTLFQTYQRILDSAFDENSDEEARGLVRKTLHWIAISSPPLTIPQLCEAVSLHDGDDTLDDEDIMDESEIARVCSSLIRKTRDGKRFEFAHFTVREFLETLPPSSDLAAFRLDPAAAARSLSLASLQFLLLQRYGTPLLEDEYTDLEDRDRDHSNSFYTYAAVHWLHYAKDHFADPDVLAFAGRLFDPSKQPQFLRFAYAVLVYVLGVRLKMLHTKIVNILAPDFTPLHLAALLGIPELCAYLVEEEGLDVDVFSIELGFSLDAAQAGLWALSLQTALPFRDLSGSRQLETIELLVQRNACCTLQYASDINDHEQNGPLAIFERIGDAGLCTKIIANAIFNRQFIHRFREDLVTLSSTNSFVKKLIHEICNYADAHPDKSLMLTELITAVRDVRSHIPGAEENDKLLSKSTSCPAPTTSAGLLQIMKSNSTKELRTLLEKQFRECCEIRFEGGQNFLHVAAAEPHPASVKALLAAGFPIDMTDDAGDTALHKCSRDNCVLIAKLLLENGANPMAANKNGKTVWHLAAATGSVAILDFLISFGSDVQLALETTDSAGYTPIASAILFTAWGSAQFLVEHCDCRPAYFKSPCSLSEIVIKRRATHFVKTLERENAIRSCFLRENDSPPLIYATFDTDTQIVEALLPYTDAEVRYNGKPAVQYAIEEFWKTPERQSFTSQASYGQTFAALLTPKVMQEEWFNGKMLWEFFCLFPTGICGAIDILPSQDQISLFYGFLRFASTAGITTSFELANSSISAAAPLLPVFHAWDSLGFYKGVHSSNADSNLAIYVRPDVEDNATRCLLSILVGEHASGKVQKDRRSDHRYTEVTEYLKEGELPRLGSLTQYLFGVRDYKNQTANLGYILTLDLPEAHFERFVPHITMRDLASCDIRVFARICQSLATNDSMLPSYYCLKALSHEDRLLLFPALCQPNPSVSEPLVWPKTADDDSFDWKQTFTIAYSYVQPRQFVGCNLMHAAALLGLTFVIHVLIENKVFDVNVLSEDGCTPLLFATIGRRPGTIRYLRSQGADLSLGSKQGWLPHMFVEEGDHIWGALFLRLWDKFKTQARSLDLTEIERLPAITESAETIGETGSTVGGNADHTATTMLRKRLRRIEARSLRF